MVKFDDEILNSIQKVTEIFTLNPYFYAYVTRMYSIDLTNAMLKKRGADRYVWRDTFLSFYGNAFLGNNVQLENQLQKITPLISEVWGKESKLNSFLADLWEKKRRLDFFFKNQDHLWKTSPLSKLNYRVHCIEKLVYTGKVENSLINVIKSKSKEKMQVMIFEPVYGYQKFCVFSRNSEDVYYGLSVPDFVGKFPTIF